MCIPNQRLRVLEVAATRCFKRRLRRCVATSRPRHSRDSPPEPLMFLGRSLMKGQKFLVILVADADQDQNFPSQIPKIPGILMDFGGITHMWLAPDGRTTGGTLKKGILFKRVSLAK